MVPAPFPPEFNVAPSPPPSPPPCEKTDEAEEAEDTEALSSSASKTSGLVNPAPSIWRPGAVTSTM